MSTTPENTTDENGDTPQPVVQRLDPRTLLTDRNIRVGTGRDPKFVKSIRDHGVLVPIVAVRTAEGEIRVRFGHERTAAAIETGQATVPVVVVADEATDDAAQIERLVTQWEENERRAGLSAADKVNGIEQLAAFGLSAAKITKQLHYPRPEVDAALTVARSQLAKAATVRYGDFLDITQLAVVAEFEDDTEAVKELISAAKAGRFDHTAQRMRDQRDEARQREAIAAELHQAGVTVIERPAHLDKPKALENLKSGLGHQLTPENHASCPGHAAYVATLHGYVDPRTGQPVDGYDGIDEEDEDYDDEPDADQDQEQGEDSEAGEQGEAIAPVWRAYLGARYMCTDPAAYGHLDPARQNAGKTPADQLSPAEREAARAARRDVIDSNKAWVSAEKVRRAWVKTFVTRKSAPKGTAVFVATALAADAEIIAKDIANARAAELLGCPTGGNGHGRNAALITSTSEATDARAQLLLLAQVLTGYESSADKNAWRHPRQDITRYLRFIQAHGYQLSTIERRACGEKPEPEPEPESGESTD